MPDGSDLTGRDCVELAAAYGVPLDGWQADIVRGILRESDGTWSASQAGVVVARQSGKGQILLALELFGLFELGEQILHTAHAVKTSSDAFRRLWSVIQSDADLAGRVRRHSQMIGAEYVELDTGARIAFTTRSASAGRGLTIDRLIVDEAEDLPAAEVGALQPTVYSRPRAQSLFFGTAPGPTHDSEAFTTMRKSARDGLNSRLAWWEWCAEWGDDIDDHDVWIRTNPAVATGRVPLQAIIDDRAVLPPDTFRAERLSMWVPRAAGDQVFDASVWEALTDPSSVPAADLAIGVDAGPSRDAATVCVAGRRKDGRLHVEWYMTAPGVTWLPGWIAGHIGPRVRAVVIDERGALAELDWTGARVRPTRVGHRDVAIAAGQFVDAVADDELKHRGQVELSRGVLAAKQRPMLGGQAFGWDRKAPGSSALIAASLALWGVGCVRPARPYGRRTSQREAIILS
ncbi:phage terminase family protein [Mycolicibacterium chlorophenolicum]|uniref:phage terminase family protein n=1 Tax=Mycolicibacterium chlorophenolicum TaxID=37916 RepID=UPI001F242213|nr:phage terminase family protein [Mycolicibacterium chlorophenolicum]